MVGCFVARCNHDNTHYFCKFYRFPKDVNLLNKWKKLVRRLDKEPTNDNFICSCHFVDGKKENSPTIFPDNTLKRFTYKSPERSVKNPRIVSKSTESSNDKDNGSCGTSVKISMPVVGNSKEATFESQSTTESVNTETSSHSKTSSPENIITETQSNVKPATPITAKKSTMETPFEMKSSVLKDAEIYFLEREVESLKKEIQLLKKQRFRYSDLKDDEKLIKHFSGFPSTQVLNKFMSQFENIKINYHFAWKVEVLSRKDQIFLTLMKLRNNYRRLDLIAMFGVSENTISNIIITWLNVLHEVIYPKLMDAVPLEVKNPECSSGINTFTNCRMILGCTEVNGTVLRGTDKQKYLNGRSKHDNSFKGLLGVSPNGDFIFISDLYPSSTSEREMATESGVLQLFAPGDVIFASEELLREDMLPDGVSHNIPPPPLSHNSPSRVSKAQILVKARSHIEKAIRRIKSYQIVDTIPYSLLQVSDIVWQTCGALVNYHYPVIQEVEHNYSQVPLD